MSYIGNKDFLLEVAKGNIVGHSFINKFGQNEDIGTGAFEDIWDGGGTYNYPIDGTAPITKIDSSTTDTVDIEVQGLDINGALVTQTKTLTGTTPVTLETPLWRVFRMKNINGTPLVGTVQAVNDADDEVYAKITIGNEQTLMALYTIPLGKTGYMIEGGVSIAGLTRTYSIDGHLYMRPYGGVYQIKNTFGLSSDGSSFTTREFKIPSPIPEKTDIRIRGISSTAGGVMNATFTILLVDN